MRYSHRISVLDRLTAILCRQEAEFCGPRLGKDMRTRGLKPHSCRSAIGARGTRCNSMSEIRTVNHYPSMCAYRTEAITLRATNIPAAHLTGL